MTQGRTVVQAPIWHAFSAALALASVVAGLVLRNVVAAEVMTCLCLGVVCYVSARLAADGHAPDGARSYALPLAVGLWFCGHLIELASLAVSDAPMPVGPSDLFFCLTLGALCIVAAAVWQRQATYVEGGALLRFGLDILLIAVGLFAVYYQAAVQPLAEPDTTSGVVIACAYVAFSGVVAAALVTRAWQRSDAGSWLLAAAGCLAVLGVAIWSIDKFGPDLRAPGLAFMCLGALLLPMAQAHPSHRRLVVVQDLVERDRMGALAFHLFCLGVAYLALSGRPLRRLEIGTALASVVLIYLRVFLVRTSEQRLVGRLRVLAFTDPLTGVGNRRSLLTQLTRDGEGWLITVDLDGFKQINDQYGHEAGDEVLVGFVERVKAQLPQGAHLARIGGDEFAVLFNGDTAAAEGLGELIVTLAKDPHYARLTASVGLTWHAGDSDPNTTLRNSDIAMQEAKRTGKNRLARLTTTMVESRLRNLDLAARIAADVAAVEVVYQPIVALSPGHPMVAVEALARWSHPELGPISPDEFIPIAEQHGLIADLGEVVLCKAVRQLQTWIEQGVPRQVSLNVSWLQLRDAAAVRGMAAVIDAAHVVAPWLVLEVTESVFSEDDSVVSAVRLLRDLGVSIAVDDFGTGASNLQRLRALPLDVLKIDRSLLTGIGVDPAADAMLSMVNRLGEALGMSVIAEGVESIAESRLLAEFGVSAAQGFAYFRPGAAEDLPASIPMLRPWLRRQDDPAGPPDAGSEGEDQLADVGGVGQVLMGVGGTGERVAGIDHGPDGAVGDERPHELPDTADDGRLLGRWPGPQGGGQDGGALAQQLAQVQFSLDAAHQPDHDQPPGNGQGVDVAR